MTKPLYANEETKKIALSISGIVGIADVLLEAGRFRGSDEALEHLRVIKEEAQRAVDAVLEGLDEDQIQGILRYGRLCEFTLVPKTSPVCNKGFFIFDKDDVEAMLRDPLSHCMFCDLKGKDAKRCVLRKALLKTGVIELDEKDKLYGNCPYQM